MKACVLYFRKEVLGGVWTWATQPDSEERRVGTGGLLPQLYVKENAREEDMKVLTSPRCDERRTAHLSVTTP